MTNLRSRESVQNEGAGSSCSGDLWANARAAASGLRGLGRAEDGTAGAGNTLALKSGLHSKQLLGFQAIAEWHQAQVDSIVRDLGGLDALSTMELAAVREAARLELILSALGDDVFAHGPLTAKGRMRAATMVYLKTLDRFTKLIAQLGLRRRAKPVDTFAAAIKSAGSAT